MPSTREAGLRLVAEGGLYTFGLFAVRAGNFLLLPLYLSLLDPAEYGAFGVVRQLVAVLVPLAVAGQAHSVLRLVVDLETEGPEAPRRLIRSVVGWVLLATLVLGGAAAAGWPLLGRWVDGVPLWPLGVAGLALAAGQGLFNVVQVWLQSKRRAREHTLLSVARLVLLVAGVAIGVLWLQGGATGLLLAMAASFGGVALIALPLVLRGPPALHGPTLRASLAYGLPLLPHGLATVLFAATGQVLLATDGLSQAGTYLLATQLGAVVSMVGVGVQKAWAPFFLREDRDRADGGWERVRVLSFFSLLAVAAVTVAVGLLGPELVGLAGLFSADDWSAAGPVVAVLAFAALVRSYYLVALTVVLANKATARWLAAVTLPAAALNVVLTWLWIPSWGMAGAAWATVVAWGATALATGVLARRARAVPFKYGRGLVLLGLTGAALALGAGQPLLLRLGVLGGWAVAAFALDAGDILRSWRSLRG